MSELKTIEERRAEGRALRVRVPRSSHAGWTPGAHRPDPVVVLEERHRTRVPELVPIRIGRMLVSPFTFLRGAAEVMAHDLAQTPVTGVRVQACGDAHLLNFGVFATPERHLVFDVNDFDETLPGPWEWDVKRLAASIAVAARTVSDDPGVPSSAVRGMVQSYRERMGQLAVMAPIEGESAYDHHGQRVVSGQRLMQAASDIFLGWATGPYGHDYYVRQLRDMKGSVNVDLMSPDDLGRYSSLCGLTLARAHARSGDAAVMAGYLGTGDQFDRAIVAFAEGYADQTVLDHAALQQAVADGRIEAVSGR